MLRAAGRVASRLPRRRLSSASNGNKPETSRSSASHLFATGIVGVTAVAVVASVLAYQRDPSFRAKVDDLAKEFGIPLPSRPRHPKRSEESQVIREAEDKLIAAAEDKLISAAEDSLEKAIETRVESLSPSPPEPSQKTAAEGPSSVSAPAAAHPETEVPKVEHHPVVAEDVRAAVPSDEPEQSVRSAEATKTEETPKPAAIIDTEPHLGGVRAEEAFGTLTHDVIPRTLDELMSQTAVTRREIEQSILRDLGDLDEHALRLKLLQLAADFFERTKWEGVRLHHALRQVEAEVAGRYKDLMTQQRSELELEAEKSNIRMLAALQAEATSRHEEELVRFERELRTALQQQAEDLRAQGEEQLRSQAQRIHEELQDQLHHEVARLREGHVKSLVELQERLESVGGLLKALTEAVEMRHQRGVFSAATHAQAAAILALESSLERTTPLRDTVDVLRATCSEDELASALLKAIPARAMDKGVPTTTDLRKRFEVVRAEVRKAALAPANAPSLVGQAVGSILASVSWAPSGFVPGEGIEERLARAHFLLEHDDLSGCLRELRELRGLSTVLMRDWLDLAESRLSVEQVLRGLRANSALQHVSLAEAYAKEPSDA